MATLVAQPSVPTNFAMPRHTSSFKGDQDSHLNDLIVASQTKHVDNVVLKERHLVPFFDTHVEPAALQPLQAKKKGATQHQHQQHDNTQYTNNASNKKQRKPNNGKITAAVVEDAGLSATAMPPKPPRSKGGKNKTATAAKQVNDTAQQQQSRKHHRDPSFKHLPGLALPGGGSIPATAQSAPAPATSGRQSPPRKRQEQNFFDTAASMPAKFAGPAFTNSPMPDDLPIPTTSLLLMHEAADKMAQGLML